MARGRRGLLHDHRSVGSLAIAALRWTGEALFGIAKRYPLITIVLLVGLVGYTLHDFTSGDVVDLRVGDCFDLPPEVVTATVLKEVQHRPCSTAHSAELLFVGSVQGANDEYPTVPQFLAFVKAECSPAYRDYTGREYDTDLTYEMKMLWPTADGWAAGDRALRCFVVRADGAPMTASLRAAP